MTYFFLMIKFLLEKDVTMDGFDVELLDFNTKDKELEKGFDIYNDIHVFLKGSSDIAKSARSTFTKKKLDSLADVLSKRFGLNIEFGTDLACGACTISTTIDGNTSISRNTVMHKKIAEEYENDVSVSKKQRDFLKGYLSVLENTRKSFVTGVTIDYKKAKIYGLKKKAISKVYLDFSSLIGMYNLSPREVMAAILHEVGHSFTSIMYMHKISGNSISHEESLAKWIGGDKSKTTLKIGKSKVDLTSRDSVKIITREIKSEIDYIKNTFSDSERQADSFATSFGYGESLASALAKMMAVDPKRSLTFTTNSDLFNTIMSTVYLFFFIPLHILIAVHGTLIFDVVLTGLITAITLLMGTSDSNNTTYDDAKDRLDKIKRNMVRGLREKLIPPEQIEGVLDSIDRVEAYLDKLLTQPYLIESIYNYFNGTANVTKLYNTLETLSENDLHYLKERLK